jgi:ubiquinone/menaquinone biosynthesis C-methylase UbiE
MAWQRVDLLPRDALVPVGGTEHADWNYHPIVGPVLRRRHALVVSLLPHGERLLELGYGSGMMMRELARHCRELYGLDLHDRTDEVAAALARFGLRPHLQAGDMRSMPYDDAYFDTVVAESVLAHVDGIDVAAREIRRVLRRDGVLVAVVPGQSRVLDASLRLFTRARARDDFADRQAVMPALLRHFEVEQRRTVPRRGPGFVRLYTAARLRPRDRVQ